MRTGGGPPVRVVFASTSMAFEKKNDEAREAIARAVAHHGASKVARTLGCARATLLAYLAGACRQTTSDSIPLRAPLLAQLDR